MEGSPRFFSRNISVNAFEKEDGKSFVLTGTLKDERLLPFRHYLTGAMRDPGVIHDMTIEIEISLPELQVISARTRMDSVPNEECLLISGCVEKIVGLSIKRGFTKKVRDLLGESRGCLHLTNLILVMASAAAQALWAFYGSRKKPEDVQYRDLDEDLLVNSCWLWREEGPYAAKLRREKKKSAPALLTAPVIAIDGPAGSGKSTISRLLAKKLGFTYLDTGAIYRTVAVLSSERGIAPDDGPALAKIGAGLELEFREENGRVRVISGGRDMTDEIRTEKAGMLASRISALPEVRRALLPVQRGFARRGGIVCEGRDMGTVVFPEALLKVYLDADIKERARRRHGELASRGVDDYDSILREIEQRDRQDMERGAAPLKASPDAVVVDTTGLTIRQVVEMVWELACGRLAAMRPRV